MKKFNTKLWVGKQKIINSLSSQKTKNKLSVAKASIYSILFGLIIGIIIIFANGANGFAFIFSSINYSLKNTSQTFLPTTINYFSTYALMGIGLALGFKIGLFNMGGTGQAVIGMILSVLAIGNKATSSGISFKDVDNIFVINVFLIFIFSGIAVSLISGILKVTFNIHEVVTTVMLNWIVWIFANWIFDRVDWQWSVNHSTEKLNTNWVSIGGNTWLLGFILTLVSVALVYILINLTTYGYKFRVAGSQPTAAKYAGINIKFYIILTTALQGLFISMGGFIYYMTIQLSITTGKISELPTIGFDAIPIALVAFSNVFGILPVAFLWAMLKNGSGIAKSIEFSLLSKDVSMLVFGAITYGAGVSALFFKLKIYEYIYRNYFIFYNYNLKQKWSNCISKIWSLRKEKINIKKNKALLEIKNKIKNLKNQKDIKKDYHLTKQEIKNNLSYHIREEKNNFKIIFDDEINNFKKYSIQGFKNKNKKVLNNKRLELFNNYVSSINKLNIKVNDIKKYSELDNWKKEIKNLKVDFEKNNFELYKKYLEEKIIFKINYKNNLTNLKQEINILKKEFKNLKKNTSDKKDKVEYRVEFFNKRKEVAKKYVN
ncbi:ribose/galactose ABC transporter permease [Spiroplasma gladiatoris]|uniref:Ribose/galactose ABC transporter permease n=1 Tax=Spiroplasma gladiatoris TaxID=2143 RepID=A0A4P7AJN7_9MOLU|nr:ABC transporter permease [Spiroplasma gladiatoris]QBQ07750.1 ribose/galactose ABC transporter permease [Spiroplasma gladiatoris]